MIAALLSLSRPPLPGQIVRWGWAVCALLVVCLAGRHAAALEVPALTGRVVDQADVLPADAERRLTELLAAHEAQSGQQFAVLTLKTLEGDALEDFSIRVVERWQLGKKGKDEGLLLLAVIDDRKVRIEVGYGLEGTVTDAVAARLIRGTIAPAFRRGDYAGGIRAALEQLMQITTGKVPVAVPEEPERQPARRQAPISMLVLMLFLLPLLLPRLAGRRGRRYWGGGFMIGGHGGGFGGGYSRGGGGFGGGFSGGGGGFGGGGASGSW